MSNTVTCDKCGVEYGIGQSPFCRDNHASGGRYGYDPLEPYDDDQLAAGPIRISNRGERAAYMAKHGIEYKDLSRYKTKLYLDMKR